MKRLVIGLGNPILGDDGVGWKIAKTLQENFELPPQVEVDYLALGGIGLMERLIGYDHAILIDAIVTHNEPVGTIVRFNLEDLPYRDIGHMGSAHDTTLAEALQLGRQMGAHLPSEINIVAVESQNVFDFSEDLTPQVESAVPLAAQLVFDIINFSGASLEEPSEIP